MDPSDDSEFSDEDLRAVLKKWDAPPAPPSLSRRVLPKRDTWRRWLLTGSIRVPVPLGVAALVLVALWTYGRMTAPSFTLDEPAPVSLADFQPVTKLEPRVVGDVR